MKEKKMLGFELRTIHNLTREIVRKSRPIQDKPPLTQLQAGIMGYLFRHQEQPIYQKNIEEEFQVSRATATNTLQVMEKNGLITRSCMDKDARLKRIRMTQAALEDHTKVEAHMAMMDQRMFAGMNADEQNELFRLLDVVRKNLETMDTELGREDDRTLSEIENTFKEEEKC